MSIDAGVSLGFKHWKRFQAERFRMKPLLGVRSWRLAQNLELQQGPQGFSWAFSGFKCFHWLCSLVFKSLETFKVHEELPERYQRRH